jgi:hypothetical protein
LSNNLLAARDNPAQRKNRESCWASEKECPFLCMFCLKNEQGPPRVSGRECFPPTLVRISVNLKVFNNHLVRTYVTAQRILEVSTSYSKN